MNDSRNAFEWGLASVLLGGVIFCSGFIATAYGPPYLGEHLLLIYLPETMSMAVLVIPALVQMIAFAVTAFGCRSIVMARRSQRPIALGLSGVMLGVVALLEWAIVGMIWYGTMQSFTTGSAFGTYGGPVAF
jgi:hypothetical protein